MAVLLERDDELATLDALVRDCRAGVGGAVLLEGPAGIGKTALLDELRARGTVAGARVLSGRGGELEREFPFAVARQLFEPAVAAAPASERLLDGAAELAAPVLAPRPVATAGGAQAFAIVHGLYWLAANLARERPLLLVVDDAHWCDPPSLRFLLHAVQRLEGLPVAIAVAARPHEPDAESELLGALALSGARTIAPAVLSAAAVGTLIRTRLGEPDAAFVDACHVTAGGNPFLTRELVGTLARDGVTPTVASTGTVGALGPEGVRRAIALRLRRLPAAAGSLVRAIAVLGEQAPLRLAARLAELDEAQAAAAVDVLAAVEVLRPALPLAFVHPIVRTAVYEQLAPAERTHAHRRAAELLADDGAEPERVAIHLLACGPTGDPWVSRSLQAAASAALARGAPDAACGYLDRALAEPPPGSDRPALVRELGRAAALANDPAAATHLAEALRLATSLADRGEIAGDLAELLVYRGEWDAALDQIATTVVELDHHPAGMYLQACSVSASVYTPHLVDRFDREEERLRALVAGSVEPEARPLALALAAVLMWRLDDPALIRDLVRRGLDEGRLLAEEGAEFIFMPQAYWALLGLDDLDGVQELADALVANAERRGSVVGVALSSTFQGSAHLRRGALREAEAGVRVGFDLAAEHGLAFVLPSILYCGLDAILERPGLADVAALATTLQLPVDLEGTVTGALLFEVRGHVCLASGDTVAGIAGLRRCGELFEMSGLVNPVMSPWRSVLAVALRESDLPEAVRLAERELELARITASPRALGVALRGLGLVVGGEEGIALLRQAVDELERSPTALELARAHVDLGSAVRRAGRRQEARESLRAGLDLARRCGAERLAERAEHELRASGARPRRRALSGVDALTASERRIAELVATGLTNQQVAERLFLTAKTVENHLGRIYRKLDIHGRGELATALAAGARG